MTHHPPPHRSAPRTRCMRSVAARESIALREATALERTLICRDLRVPICGRWARPMSDCRRVDERFEVAAQRILAGDESVRAAQQLEGVLLDDYPGDERFDDLLEALAFYAPGEGAPYVDAHGLQAAIKGALATLARGSADAD
jgi:hypothetical protein